MKDSELAELAEEYRRLKAKEDKVKAARAKVGQKLVKEMQSRGTRGIVTGGLKVSLVAPEIVEYDVVGLERVLSKKGIWEEVTERVFSRDRLSAAVQEGKIKPSILTKFSKVKPKAPYVLVTDE